MSSFNFSTPQSAQSTAPGAPSRLGGPGDSGGRAGREGATDGERMKWYCHECHQSFREPVLNGGNDLPLCPHCRSDVVEERDFNDSSDGWFTDNSEDEHEHHGPSSAVGGLMRSFQPPRGMGAGAGSSGAGGGAGGGAGAGGQGQQRTGLDVAMDIAALIPDIFGAGGGSGRGSRENTGSASGSGGNRGESTGSPPGTRTFRWGNGPNGSTGAITFGAPTFRSGNGFVIGSGSFGNNVGNFGGMMDPTTGRSNTTTTAGGSSSRINNGLSNPTQNHPPRADPAPTSTLPPDGSVDGRHWHIGEDEAGHEIEYEVYAHGDGEEGIPVFNEVTGLPNIRPHAPNPHDHPNAGGPPNPFEGGMSMEDMISSLMQALSDPNGAGLGGIRMGGGAPLMTGNPGDYVFTQEGLDAIMEQMMAQGHQGPPPATRTVIDGLPRVKVDQASLDASQYKDCSVCQDNFELGQEVIKIPCKHIFHTDCLVPWLETNGTCPVCRFSLVSEDEREQHRTHVPAGLGGTGPNIQTPTQNLPNPFQAVVNGFAHLFGGARGDAPHPPATDASAAARQDTETGSMEGTQNIPGNFPTGPADLSSSGSANTAPATRPTESSSASPLPTILPSTTNQPIAPRMSTPLGFTPPISARSPSIFADRSNSPSYFNGTARPIHTPGPAPSNNPVSDVHSGAELPIVPYPNAIPQEHRQRFAQQEEEMRRQRRPGGSASESGQNEPNDFDLD